jgi:multiple sugar transport system substrate-binding protein
VSSSDLARRDFLRLAAGGATLLATGMGCGSGSKSAKSKPNTATSAAGSTGKPTLRIAQWNHYVAGYDQWWDTEYTKRWGERNGVEVIVDHFDINQAPAHAESEVASQRGHDLFNIILASPSPLEDHVIDHREIVEEVEAKVGKMTPFVNRSVFNPKTKKYFGFSDYWGPSPIHYRTDLWGSVGSRPDSWEEVVTAGLKLKGMGHPIGIGMGDDPEGTVTLLGLLHGYGASIQDENAEVVINSRAAVEAVKVGAELFRSAMTADVLNWDIASNNRYLVSGRGSLIVNSIAAIRALETQDPALAANIGLLPVPRGPQARLSPYAMSVYVIWKFSENQEAAKRFLVDLATDYREPLVRSGFLQIPSFPGAVSDLAGIVSNDARAQPGGKYGLLSNAVDWQTNVGYPGHFNAATDEVVKSFIVPRMFAAVARGEMSAEESVRAAEAKIKPIFEKWRERGKI